MSYPPGPYGGSPEWQGEQPGWQGQPPAGCRGSSQRGGRRRNRAGKASRSRKTTSSGRFCAPCSAVSRLGLCRSCTPPRSPDCGRRDGMPRRKPLPITPRMGNHRRNRGRRRGRDFCDPVRRYRRDRRLEPSLDDDHHLFRASEQRFARQRKSRLSAPRPVRYRHRPYGRTTRDSAVRQRPMRRVTLTVPPAPGISPRLSSGSPKPNRHTPRSIRRTRPSPIRCPSPGRAPRRGRTGQAWRSAHRAPGRGCGGYGPNARSPGRRRCRIRQGRRRYKTTGRCHSARSRSPTGPAARPPTPPTPRRAHGGKRVVTLGPVEHDT